ncbi:MAG: rRNA maturation RNase YbeY [Bacteroidales bacterium]|nr:rRNA maturation RNase YbeY [Bacteroidales bacterium]
MILFHSNSHNFTVKNKALIKAWLKRVAESEGRSIGQIDIIFCSDEELLEMNKKHLNHDYFTDIITFDYSDRQGIISGDLYISTDRVSDNARKFDISDEIELRRVMVHGILHLVGFNDRTDEEISLIREKEELYLSLYP